MKIIISLLLFAMFVSCAHHHEKPDHHHHAFDKKCAYSVAHGDLNVEGKNEYQFEHGGRTYYFSTKEKREKFVKDIEESVRNANRNWPRNRER